MNRRAAVAAGAVVALVVAAVVYGTVVREDDREPQVAGRLLDRAKGLVYDGLLADTEACGPKLFQVALPSGAPLVCTHGPDPVVDGGDATSPPPEPRAAEPQSGGQIICDGDGTSGNRVQMVYVVPQDRADRSASLPFTQYAVAMDAIFNASAAKTGGTRHVRFVTNPDCSLNVAVVRGTAQVDDTFSNTIKEVSAAGYNRTDRKYSMWVDGSGYCGIAGVRGDDQPGAANANNKGPSYARTDPSCWGGYVEAHELVHTLGAVQLSAPNSSGGWHCVDENDVQCYSDAPNQPTLKYLCASSEEQRFDCGNDDYFSTAPTGYLATHWNTASSSFLIAGEGTPPPTTTTTTSTTTTTTTSTTTTTTQPTTTTTTQPTTTTTRRRSRTATTTTTTTQPTTTTTAPGRNCFLGVFC